MEGWQSRTELLMGSESIERLSKSAVMVFGLGGVGSYAAEALARCGVGRLALIDDDVICPSNLNRQLIALHSTMGRPKAEVTAERALDINPGAIVEPRILRYDASTAKEVELAGYDYIVDAIDSVYSKLLLIERAKAAGVPIISCMGAGNKLDPTAFRIADISKTSVCPLARVMRRELKKRGISGVDVLYSTEPAIRPAAPEGERPETGSVSFVPSVAGLIIAGHVIKKICGAGRSTGD